MEYKYVCLSCQNLVFETKRNMGKNPYCPCCGFDTNTQVYFDPKESEENNE